MPPLDNPRHEKFALLCFEKPENTDGENYLEAGFNCTKDSARKNATKLRHSTTIVNRLLELEDAAASAKIMTVQEIEERLSEIGRARVPDFVTCGPDGTWINVGLEQCHSAAIKEVTSATVVKQGKDGEEIHTGIVTNLKLHDPTKAMDMLLKRKGAYPPVKMEHTGKDGQPIEIRKTYVGISPDDWEKLKENGDSDAG